jgi:hypothetical protein
MPKTTLYAITGLPVPPRQLGVLQRLDQAAELCAADTGDCQHDHEAEFRAAVDEILKGYGFEVAGEFTEHSWGGLHKDTLLLDVLAARRLPDAGPVVTLPHGVALDAWEVATAKAPATDQSLPRRITVNDLPTPAIALVQGWEDDRTARVATPAVLLTNYPHSDTVDVAMQGVGVLEHSLEQFRADIDDAVLRQAHAGEIYAALLDALADHLDNTPQWIPNPFRAPALAAKRAEQIRLTRAAAALIRSAQVVSERGKAWTLRYPERTLVVANAWAVFRAWRDAHPEVSPVIGTTLAELAHTVRGDRFDRVVWTAPAHEQATEEGRFDEYQRDILPALISSALPKDERVVIETRETESAYAKPA